MYNFKRQASRALSLFVCLTIFCSLLLTGLPPAGAEAAMESQELEEAENAEIYAASEAILRRYQEWAMLYELQDLRFGAVADPMLSFSEEAEARLFHVAGEDVTLAQLRGNFTYLEKKAVFYSTMRQMQGIYREDLRLFYNFDPPKLVEDGVASVSVKETAEFRYTDSDRKSVYETFYTVRLVKPEGQWLVADVTDGTRFDKLYKEQGAAFDEDAAIAEFAANLERDGCTVYFPYTPSDGAGKILYNGANAAAYAYTYARPSAEAPRSAFYNPLFYSYAGQGGDCQNFASQCMWAGFGGNQTSAAIRGHALPMDVSGGSTWFGRPASGGTINYSWISCQNFRKYLTGTMDGTGQGGSNAAGDTGMYATILDVSAGSAFSGVTAEELVGATAHVEGSGGNYSHAIVITAATGTSRGEIWFCGHTKDVAHLKLGDYYIWPIMVYIPRYLRTGSAGGRVETDCPQPIEAGSTGLLNARTDKPQYQITITVTPPGGTAERPAAVNNTDYCEAAYTFTEPGLYQVVCGAKEAEGSNWALATYYVRCYGAEQPVIEIPADSLEEFPEPEEIEEIGEAKKIEETEEIEDITRMPDEI